jgi:hypothetical protein
LQLFWGGKEGAWGKVSRVQPRSKEWRNRFYSLLRDGRERDREIERGKKRREGAFQKLLVISYKV